MEYEKIKTSAQPNAKFSQIADYREAESLKKGRLFLKNALTLSLVSILMRALAVSFNAYVNRKIGPESMGLFTLVMSVYAFAVTLALSCVNLGAVRLTSERAAKLEEAGADAASWRFGMRRVIRAVSLYSLLFGTASGALLYAASNVIAARLLGDMRTVSSLRVLALSLPAISLSSALSGYFTGLRKAGKNAVAAVTEQLVKIAVTSTALMFVVPDNVESACLAVVGGSAVAEAWTLILHFLLYLTDSKRPGGIPAGKTAMRTRATFSECVGIALPAAVGAYARQGLTTLEHLAIPKGLVKSGLTQETALAQYGLLQGIAFPLVMFPYAVIHSFTSLLVPEMAERHALGDTEGMQAMALRVYRYSALFSVAACGVFVNYARELGMMIYDSGDAARYTLLLGALVPFMYLDTAVDALLKGMGEQVYSMKVNIADAASGLILVILLTPALGIYGYLLTIWLCEVGNLAASIHRLGRVTGVGIRDALPYYVRPLGAAAALSVMHVITLDALPPLVSMVAFLALYALLTLGLPERGVRFLRKTEPAA